MMNKQKMAEMLEDEIKTDYRAGRLEMKKKEISNLLCPKCGKTITGKDLKFWKCVKCGAEFKVEFGKKKKDTTYFYTTKTADVKIIWAIK